MNWIEYIAIGSSGIFITVVGCQIIKGIKDRIEKLEEAVNELKDKCVKEPTITYRPPYDSSHRVQRVSGKYHVLLAVTGSVATIKTAELIQELYRQSPPNKLTIKVIATPSALNFFNPEELADTTVVYDDRDEWNMWKKRGDPVLHIELRKWADSLLIAPLDANTMAKVANGICDNLVTSTIRAWDPKKSLCILHRQ